MFTSEIEMVMKFRYIEFYIQLSVAFPNIPDTAKDQKEQPELCRRQKQNGGIKFYILDLICNWILKDSSVFHRINYEDYTIIAVSV